MISSLNQEYKISDAQINAFRNDGHVLLKAVATEEEIAHFQPVIHQASATYNTETRKLEERDTYGKAFLQIMNLWTRDEEVKNFVFARKFAGIAAKLLGVEKVRIYHDQALYKEPHGGATPWHQDQYYWPLDTEKTVTMWMPLINITEAMGMLTFASASHKNGLVDNTAISDKSEEVFSNYILDNQLTITKAAAMQAGDATFHYGWTLHSAGANHSPDITREVMTIIYFADGAKVLPPINKHQQNDLTTWLDNTLPGQAATSFLNPVIS